MIAQVSLNFFFFPESPGGIHGIGIPRLLQLPCCSRSPGDSSRRIRRTRWECGARTGGYTRIPLDTAGAYQLIDDETGEKFIIWGGTEEDAQDSPIPSKEVLSWKSPGQPPGPLKVDRADGPKASLAASDGNGKPTSHPGGSNVTVGTFGRLKVQKVRALIKNKRNSSSQAGQGDSRASEFVTTTKKKYAFPSDDEEIQESRLLDAIPRQELGAKAPNKKTTPPVDLVGQRRKSTAADDGGFFSRKSFKDLGCSDDVIESLRRQHFSRPSHIQAMAYAPILVGKSCVVADQSGSGKTLAYLAPMIQRLRQEELLGLGKSSPGNPRVVILVPTAELASQVLNNCRLIAKSGVPFRSMVATGGFRQKTQLDNLQQELDVLIATPGRFIYLLKEGFLQLANLKSAVLDEVDILFGDEGFEQVLQSLISSGPVTAQYLFVTATLPVVIYNKLVEVFPDCEVIMGPGMHRTSAGLEEILVDCSGADGEEKNPDTAFLNKKSALLRLVEESRVPKTIVFCNKIETCRKVENILKRFDRKELHMKVLPFHAALEQELRLSNMKEFLSSQSNSSLFLICTDRASRGIDYPNVDHVVLFDFPRDPSEYVRRVGRTARGVGGKGKAFVFVVGKQVSLARRIMERNKKGHPLHDVPSAFELEASIL